MATIGAAFTETGGIALELAMTKLQVAGGELVRLNSNGNVGMRLPLAQVKDVEFKTQFDPYSLVFAVSGLGIGAIAHFISVSDALTVLLYLLAVVLVGAAFLGCTSHRLYVTTAQGVTMILCADQADEGAGFADSLRAHLAARAGMPVREGQT